jgi:hypothetical protein
VSDLGYLDIRPILARLSDLDRDLVLVGGQAVNFWAFVYEGRVPALARAGPFASRDVDFCGDRRTVRLCAQRLGGLAHVSTMDDATPNNGTVVFVDPAVLDGGFEFDDPQRTILKLNERVFRFCMHDRDARELHRRHPEIDPARGILDDRRLPKAFREKRLVQMRDQLATRGPDPTLPHEVGPPRDRGRRGGPER